MHNYTFDCGCSFPIVEERKGTRPKIDINPNHLPDCQKVWDMLSEGKTKGVFQLESNVGKKWARELKPQNIEQLAALSAIIRPGVAECIDENNNSYTKKYCLRKNGHEEITYKYNILEPILCKTYGLMIYQEQMLKISELLCDFSLIDQDALRKGVGKKDQAAVAKVGLLFIEKGLKKGLLSKEQLEDIFEDIKKSGRYLFNKSHAISYAIKGYQSAYIKAHITNDFFASWLLNAHNDSDPRQEILELVEDARSFDINIQNPDVLSLESNITTDGTNIRFGLSDVKGVGEKQVEKLVDIMRNKDIDSWNKFLYLCTKSEREDCPTSTAIKNWIGAGAFKWTNISRARMIKEYDTWKDLKDGERNWIAKNSLDKPLVESLKLVAKVKKDGGGCSSVNRITVVQSLAQMLEKQASSDEDHPNQIVDMEEATLGVAISCTRIDGCDNSLANTKCKEIASGKMTKSILAVEVKDAREFKTKTGKNVGSLFGRGTISDETMSIPFVIWSEQWDIYKDLFKVKNTLLLEGQKDKFGSFVVRKAFQL